MFELRDGFTRSGHWAAESSVLPGLKAGGLSMNRSRVLVLGTHNQKKHAELADLLAPLGFRLLSLADFPTSIEVVEDGSSFAANAELKATQQSMHLGEWVLGEDSGISVDALQGAPGIMSARYSGAAATDSSNNELLLKELGDLAMERRTAHYTCHLCLSDPEGNARLHCEEVCRGRIRFQAAGSAGFGYDPLFEIREYHRSFGELGMVVKAFLSHRARAIRSLVPQLLKLAENTDW